MDIIKRTIQKNIENSLFKQKIIIIYGARQVGKTTLVKQIQAKYPQNSICLNCDEPDIREALTNKTSTEIKLFLGNNKLVIIDEAQRVENIGLTLKLIIDTHPEIQVIATGSSSFDLSNKIIEPLTGRKIEFFLMPISLAELAQKYSPMEIKRILSTRLIFGQYPGLIFNSPGEAQAKLQEITRSYLFKDVLAYEKIRNSSAVEKLLKALALQIGNEVSYNELSSLVGVNKKTIENYIKILEQAFIIFILPPFSRNLRNELKKMRKIYFYDVGIRNALINNFNKSDLRNDLGALWENFLISERMKFNNNSGQEKNTYFWRTTAGQEIDYLEEAAGRLSAYEFKWQKEKAKQQPKVFKAAYPQSEFLIINQDNFLEFCADVNY